MPTIEMTTDPRLQTLHASIAEHPYSGEVTSLCIRKEDGIRQHPDQIEVNVEKGVLGDRWVWRTWKHLPNGDSDPRVQVAVCNSRVIELLQKEKNNPYHPGDNIMVDRELGADEFPVGGRFTVGEITLEVTDVYNDACAKFAGEFGKDVLKWINIPEYHDLNLRGIYCRVIEGGRVIIGDKLELKM
jgi:MOSC domain-containing protein YiiM